MKCPTVNCDETINERSKKLYCKNCRSAMYYASIQPAGWAVRRARNLQKFQDRIVNRRDRKEIRE